MEWKDYFYPGTDVLRNKFKIKDQDLLEREECKATAIRTYELYANPEPGHFDLDHLKRIHARLFQDVYPFAGKLRDVDMAKGNGDAFTLVEQFSIKEAVVFSEYLRPCLQKNASIKDFASFLAALNEFHPFREGNGRAQKILLQYLAACHGFLFDFSLITPKEWNGASEDSRSHGVDGLAVLLDRAKRPISNLVAATYRQVFSFRGS